jgi:bifunctional lysine-specific demethylase and histidyl-hydroxylase MINA
MGVAAVHTDGGVTAGAAMRLSDAETLLASVLAPLTLEAFLEQLSADTWRRLPASTHPARLDLLGPDPVATLIGARAIATDLTFHSASADEPPPPLVADPDPAAFRALIDTFHARRYSVRFPGLRPYAPALDHLCRALELVLHKPVTASAFWSRGGLRAPVHADDHDLWVIQLRGRKRWYVAEAPSSLDNTWERIPGPPPQLNQHATFEVVPGDAVLLPRGTVHAVDGDEESIHVSIGCTPLTVREAVIAAVDHLSDLDRTWRTTASATLGRQLAAGRVETLTALVQQAVAALGQAVALPGFTGAALQRRSARVTGHLTPPPPQPRLTLTLDSVVRHRPEALCHLSANAETVDVAYAGGHLYVHRGAEAAVVYLVQTPRFRVRDLPGEIDDAVRLSLAQRFYDVGFLALA